MIRLLQLNILKGKYMDTILSYLSLHPFDIVTLQEVAGGSYSNNNGDNLRQLTEALSYEADITYDLLEENTPNYFGSAILFSPSFSKKSRRELRPAPRTNIAITKQDDWEKLVRSALAIRLEKEGKEFEIVTTHGAWSRLPDDTPSKHAQITVIADYLKQLTVPFIFTGDLNVVTDTEVVRLVESTGAMNLSRIHHVSNTLNPRTHYVQSLFPPGLAVDYIFPSPAISIDSFEVISSPDLSDHFGLGLAFAL